MMANERIPNFIKKRAYLTPNRIAFIFEDQEVTFLELYERSLSIAEKCVTVGMKKNDNVGVLLKNHMETIYILFGLQLLGCRAILLNNRLTPFEIAYQLKDSNATFLLTEEKYSALYSDLNEVNPILIEVLAEELRTQFYIDEETDLNDICSIMYTSGTTGNPKGVLQTYGNHWWSATGSALNLGVNERDRWICAVPLFHISGYSIVMRGIIYGMTVLLHEGFDEEKIISDIVHNQATILSVVTTMLSRLLDQLKDKSFPPTFRCMLAGGGPVPKTLLEACVGKNIPVFQTYGMTETASQVVTLSPEDSLEKLGSAGKPLFPVQLKIITPTGDEAQSMETGEIIIKGPNVTSGYLNRPIDTNEKINAGWLYTGDIGYLDGDGFLFVLDRRSDLIISGGENIYPAEIEGILLSHNQISDAGVIGVSDDVWGQVPVAFVVKKEELTEQQLVDFCQQRVAKYKIPKKFIFIDELPRNAARKLMRHRLRAWWEEQESEN
jgi:o-succinylbenzoate---CoA ligase